MKQFLLYFWYKYIGFIFRLLPIKNNRILFSNFFGKSYGDNPKYIAEELLKDNKNELVWLVKDKYYDNIPKEIKQVKRGTIKELYYLSTSKIWVDNCRKHYGITKRKKQFYIQTWHGGIGLKKIEAAADNLPKNYIKSAKNDSKMIDIIISNCTYRTNQYKNHFWYNGEIVETGLPRNDAFFKTIDKNKIKKELKIAENKKIILYAPTFRSYSYDYMQIDFNKLIKRIKEYLGENYIVLVRLHPSLANKIEIKETDYIKNVSNYTDADDLMLISDMLISDYSSIMFDYLYTNNPVYLYAPDLKEYIGNRGINFVYEELPFVISYNSDELVNNIINKKDKRKTKELKEFLNEMQLKDDGNASKRIAKIINTIIGGDKNEKI